MTDKAAEYDRIVRSIHKNPKFWDMVKRKQRFSLLLLFLTLGIYLGLIFAVAFAPDLVSKPLASGMTTSWGIPVGIFLIVWTIILTGYYIYRTNTDYDLLNEQLIKEATNETLK